MSSTTSRLLAMLTATRDDPLTLYATRAPGQGGMSPAQRRFHKDPRRLRWIIAGTQVGKTRAGAAEMWWANGLHHPFRPVQVDVGAMEVWIMLPDLDGDWPKVCSKIHEVEPRGALHPKCSWDRARGYRYGADRLIVRSNGYVLRPKSGTQHLQALEGESIGFVWPDEVPRRGHWFAALQRITAYHGQGWATFTAVGRAADWMRDYLEGNHELGIQPAPGGSKHRIRLTAENVPHRSPGWIDDQIALMDPWEIPQRRDAEWDGPAQGRRLPSWRPDLLIDDEALYALKYDRFRIGMDHGEGIGKQQVAVIGFSGRRVVVLRMWGSVSRESGAPEVAQAIVDLLDELDLTIYDIEAIVGDINTVGLGMGGGVKFNVLVEAELAKVLKLRH